MVIGSLPNTPPGPAGELPSLTAAETKRVLVLSCQKRGAWSDMVACGGVVNTERVLSLAAAIHLVRAGAAAGDAADQLELAPDLGDWVLGALEDFL